MKILKKQHKGFTLIELLTVIAIIGILAGLASAGIPMAMNKARQFSASSSLRSIAQAVVACRQQDSRGVGIKEGSEPKAGKANTVAAFAEVLARKNLLVDGEVWVVGSDTKGYDTVPKHVLVENSNQLDGGPISWDVVVNASGDGSDYPVVWLRGLSTSGEWDESAPFGESFGLIAFADASVRSYSGNILADEDNLTSASDGKPTTNYTEAISPRNNSKLKPTVLKGKGVE